MRQRKLSTRPFHKFAEKHVSQPFFSNITGLDEPGLGFPEMPQFSEPMFSPTPGNPGNDSGFAELSQTEMKPELSLQQPQMNNTGATQIKAEPGLDVSASSAMIATSVSEYKIRAAC